MNIFPLHLKHYLHLLKNYIRYDSSILAYIAIILTALFYTIMTIIHTEINDNLMNYGGLHEANTSYTVNLGLGTAQKEFSYLLELLEKYNLQKIKEIRISVPPLLGVGIASPDNPVDDFELDGRSFTEQELINGENKIILSNKDYRTYYKNHEIGDTLSIGNTDFQLIGISYTAEQSMIPLNCFLHAQTPFFTSHIILKTEHSINLWERIQLRRKYNQILSDKQKGTFSFESNFWHVVVNLWNSLSDYFLSIAFVFALCILLLFQTGSILYYKNQSHTSVYLLSGGSETFLKQIILGELIAAAVLSLFLAYLLLLGRILWIG